MSLQRIPLIPFKPYKTLRFAKNLGLIGFGSRIAKLFPQLPLYLFQAESDFNEREYATIATFAGLFWPLILASIFILISLILSVQLNLIIIFGASLLIGILSFSYVLLYPKLIITKRVRDLDKNLLFALRHLSIQVRSGVTLFDSMVSVARGGYGLVSEEFNHVVRKIGTGISDVDVLEELALRNPSLYFRRSVWQISNAIRAGADIGNTLDIIINNFSNEQRILVRMYGSQLSPLAFLYMMFGVILPSLGTTLLISLSTFSGLEIKPFIFWVILIFLATFKFNFLGLVRSRRPSVEVYV